MRGLAAALGVAPATVAAAYRTLRERGLVETAGRNGTRVRARPPVLSRAEHRPSAPAGTVDASAGEPDHRLLPALGPRLRRLAGVASQPLRYADSGPWPELVALGRERLAGDGVPVDGAAVTVTSGALDAIERLLTAHLRPGDGSAWRIRAGPTSSTWWPRWACTRSGCRSTTKGPQWTVCGRAVRAGAAAVVVTSRAQNPTGAAVSVQRARALRRVLAAAP